MFRTALFCKLPFFTALFANRPVDQRPEAISNPMSREQITFLIIHCL